MKIIIYILIKIFIQKKFSNVKLFFKKKYHIIIFIFIGNGNGFLYFLKKILKLGSQFYELIKNLNSYKIIK